MTKRKITKREITKRKITKREITKREITKREITKRKITKRKITKRKITKRKMTKRKFKEIPPVSSPQSCVGETSINMTKLFSPSKILVRVGGGLEGFLYAAGDDTSPIWEECTGDEWLSPKSIGERLGFTDKQTEALRKRLERYRNESPDMDENDDWLLVEEPGRNPRHLYRLGSVHAVVLKAAKKNVRQN